MSFYHTLFYRNLGIVYYRTILISIFSLFCLVSLAEDLRAQTGHLKALPKTEESADEDDDTEDLEGEALAFSQTELRQIAKTKIGGVVFGGSPWSQFGLLGSRTAGEKVLHRLHLGFGSLKEVGEFRSIQIEQKLRAIDFHFEYLYFVDDSMPLYLLAGIGADHWNVDLKPLDDKAKDAGFAALAFYGSAGLGMGWHTQSQWYIGVHLLTIFKVLAAVKTASSGDGEMQKWADKNLKSLGTRPSIAFQVLKALEI